MLIFGHVTGPMRGLNHRAIARSMKGVGMKRFLIPFRMDATGCLILAACVLLGVALLGWRAGAAEGVLVIASLLLHEVGHILAAVALGVPVREFGLCWRGAFTRRAYSGRRPTEILISFAGPLTNLFLAFPLYYLPVIGNQLALCNLMLCIVNLLPIPSSDGLRILRNIRGSAAASAPRPMPSEAPATLPAGIR
jgi:Zn-dependent protease